ncbi:hypothetical protein COR50_19845 [Chitinophaga caeni]|uniref:DUF4377 domain-containing protein n=1 Tax=Chitinophaga caeni TaxID=2029983 RepID=A0A291QZH4_9BACT|nr:hypothetical protein [Chitinophaga caeni]ATL49244.1 hypothetical protein COR50_19845 [Chitinophaga caeni]
MKNCYYYGLILLFLLSACSKGGFDPSDPDDGDVVNLFLDHYSQGADAQIYLNSDRTRQVGTSLTGFPERQIGYTYIVKAVVEMAPKGTQDGPLYTFRYMKTYASEKRMDTAMFPLRVLNSQLFGVSSLISKDSSGYKYSGKYSLRLNNTDMESKLDQLIDSIGNLKRYNGEFGQSNILVNHDPENYGEGYVVYKINY